MVAWRARDPVVRFRHWLASNGWWDEAQEKQLRHATRQQVGCRSNVGLCGTGVTISQSLSRHGYSAITPSLRVPALKQAQLLYLVVLV